MNSTIPPQSLQERVRFPGITKAARDLGIDRSHLWAVLSNKRPSERTRLRWNDWLKQHPEYAELQPK